jgi:hypothetical protein
LTTGDAISKLDGAELLVGPGGFYIVGVGGCKRILGFLATLLAEELPESLTDDSEDLEILVGFLLLLNLNAADIVEELENFPPSNRISILWPWHGRRLERRSGAVKVEC